MSTIRYHSGVSFCDSGLVHTGVARGALGPRTEKKLGRGQNLHEKVISAPNAEQESNF